MDFELDVQQCVDSLASGNTILYPTDTIWGLGCDALNPNAVEQLLDVKKRPAHKGFIVFLADPRDILQYVASPHPDIIDIMSGFEKPTTVIFDTPLGFPDNLLNEDGSIAIRIPDEAFCKALLKRFRRPIVSTSANISGQPSAPDFSQVSKEIKDAVSYIVRYRQNDTTPKQPSRIIRLGEDGSINILRD